MFLLLSVVALLVVNGTSKQLPSNVKQIWKDLTDSYVLECVGDSITNMIDAELLIEHAYVSNSRRFGCYMKCIYRKIGIFKPDGEFDSIAILSQMSYMTKNLTQTCIGEAKVGSDGCWKSLIIADCVVNGLSIP
ncbi:hypothetical protein FQR65_LT00481 [Abscondita terminalis]|nr:hypothetical protein FQR65_LT00481 [Abscondita terminalis]